MHFLVHKALTSDERWVEERTEDLRSKSYDASHIDSIATRYGVQGDEAERKQGARDPLDGKPGSERQESRTS